jgi:lariat debranching enzyme
VLTVFIGGNHEAANHLQELPYGGWVAPNIFYLGSSGCVRLGGIRIGGISGIFKGYDYRQGYFECAPYTDDTARSVFHMREFDVWRMQHMRPSAPATADRASAATGPVLQGPLDIVLSHDWPEGVYNHGDVRGLLRRKQHFAEEVAAGKLGNPETARLLPVLRPRFWFSAHLHVKFAALVQHGSGGSISGGSFGSSRGGGSGGAAGHGGYGGGGGAPSHPGSHSSAAAAAGGGAGGLAAHAAAASSGGESTYFLALDKCLPGRQYLQIIDVAPQDAGAPAAPPAAVGDDSGAGSGAADVAGARPAAGDATAESESTGYVARLRLEYDAEWLAVVRRTHPLLPAQRSYPRLPPAGQVSAAEVVATRELLARALQMSAAASASSTGASIESGSSSAASDAAAAAAVASGILDATAPLYIPENFVATVPGYVPPFPGADQAPARRVPPPQRIGNPQTDALLAALGLPHVVTIPYHPGQSQMGGAPPAASGAAGPHQRPGAGYSAAAGGGGAYAARGYHGGHSAGGGPMGAGAMSSGGSAFAAPYYPGAGSAAAASGGDAFAHMQQPQHAFEARPGGGMLVPSQAYHAGPAGSAGGHMGPSMAAGARGGSRPSFASRLPPPTKAGGGGGSAAFGNTGSAGYWGDPGAGRAGVDVQTGGAEGVAPAAMAVDGHPADADADVAAALSFMPSGDAAAEFHEAQWLRPTAEGHASSDRTSAAAPNSAAIDSGATSSAPQADGSGGAVVTAGTVAGPAPDPSEISLDEI